MLGGICFAQENDQPEPVILTPGADSIPLVGIMEVLRDESGKLTIGDARSPRVAARFARPESRGFGLTGTPYWYRAELRNPAESATRNWVLQVKLASLDYLDIYITRSSGPLSAVLTGDRRPPAAALLPHRTYALPLDIAPGEVVTLHLRAQTGGAQRVMATLWEQRAFQRKAVTENLAYGAYFGLLLVLGIYNLVIYLGIRDRAYLYFVLSLFCGFAVYVSVTGYGRLYGEVFGAHASQAFSNVVPVYALHASSLFAVLFAREFLQLPRTAKWASRLLLVFAAIFVVGLVAAPFVSYADSLRLNFVCSIVFDAVALIVALYLSVRGLRAARLFLLTWSTALAFRGMANMETMVGLPTDFFTNYGIEIGNALGVTLFSLALADRINTERKEAFAAREQSLKDLERFNRLKGFLPQRVADLVSSGDKSLLEPKRRKVTVLVMDLRGFTPFSETTAPEDVMGVLREFYDSMGKVVEQHGGTVEHFAGDSMLVFFNAPLEIPDQEKQAIETALEMRQSFENLRAKWARHGHDLGLGIGIADGYATIGAIGFSGRSQYAAIGAVSNLASRLCASAKHGEILTTARVLAEVESVVESESAGEQTIKGFHRPIQVERVLGLKRG